MAELLIHKSDINALILMEANTGTGD